MAVPSVRVTIDLNLLRKIDGALAVNERVMLRKAVFVCSAHRYSNCLVPRCVTEKAASS